MGERSRLLQIYGQNGEPMAMLRDCQIELTEKHEPLTEGWGHLLQTQVSFTQTIGKMEARMLRRTLFRRERIPRKLKKAAARITFSLETTGKSRTVSMSEGATITGMKITDTIIKGRCTRWTNKAINAMHRAMRSPDGAAAVIYIKPKD